MEKLFVSVTQISATEFSVEKTLGAETKGMLIEQLESNIENDLYCIRLAKELREDLLKKMLIGIIVDANNIEFQHGQIITFKSKGKDKREKKCVCKYDNRGLRIILKQIDTFAPMRYMVNGQPITNCKTIYEV